MYYLCKLHFVHTGCQGNIHDEFFSPVTPKKTFLPSIFTCVNIYGKFRTQAAKRFFLFFFTKHLLQLYIIYCTNTAILYYT